MRITLQVSGREMTFSKEELTAIVEKYFLNEAAKKEKGPTEGEWFEVNPQAIDQKLFQKERKDKRQEETRKLILDAFDMVKRYPKTYGKKFKTMMPKKTWYSKTVEELKQLACKIGDQNADWIEQALEWAQRICNGESWEAVCNYADTANWCRLVIWKSGFATLVSGSSVCGNDFPASDVGYREYLYSDRILSTVPLVVLYEK